MDNSIFSTDRLRQSSSSATRSPKQQFESDRGRILFSAPFRRLQSKAQVFSLEGNAAVRSRLTHSVEVAHIGRYISHELQRIASDKDDSEFQIQSGLIEPLVETACLLHDIGNPPFGHLGESAIKEWFKSNAARLHEASTNNAIDTSSAYYKDFLNFDGNPQGARIVLKLMGQPDKDGANLTAAQIACLIKYPRFSDEENPKYKKIAAYTPERKQLERVWQRVDLNWGTRHPLAYLMESADDIAYSMSDIEDGIEKRIISASDFFDFIRSDYVNFGEKFSNCIPKAPEDNSGIVSPIVAFRTSMINLCVEHAASYFYENRGDLPELNIKSIFHKNDTYSFALKRINDYCIKNIYSSPEAEDIEIAGYNIVHGILDKFTPLMKLDLRDFQELVNDNKGNQLNRRLASKLPKKFVDHYNSSSRLDPDNEWYIRLFLLTDYISGMTDDFALKIYRLLNGIEVSVL